MDAYLFRFTTRKLRAIPPRQLGFLIASGHCCNELVILLPLLLFEHDLKQANEVESAFILSRRLTLNRILVSKVVEYGELCAKFFKKIGSQSDSMLLEWKKDFEPISARLKSAKWARILRNKISFHYDDEHALVALQRLDAEHPLRLIAGKVKGVTLFEFAEEIVSRPIFEEAGQGDIGRGMEVSHDFIVNLVGEITAFHAKITIGAFKKYNMISIREQSVIRDAYAAVPGDIRIPITLSTSYVQSLRRKQA